MEKLKILQISKKFKSINRIASWVKELGNWHEQIRLIREALGMTQKQLADRINSTQKIISRLENNETNPTIKTLTKVANNLNCCLLISFIPKTEINSTIQKLAARKAQQLVNQSAANAAMELQKPNNQIILQSKDELKNDLINTRRSSLWEK